MKQDKKILDKIIENRMDIEFKKLGVYIRVHHFRDTHPFNGVTVVTRNNNYNWEAIGASIKQSADAGGFNPATQLLEKLSELDGIYGVAICDKRDPFNRQEGRRRAKRRLLRHIKGREQTRNDANKGGDEKK